LPIDAPNLSASLGKSVLTEKKACEKLTGNYRRYNIVAHCLMAQGLSLRQYISAGNDVLCLVLRLLQQEEKLQVFVVFCLIVRTSPIHFALLGRKRKYIKSKTTAKLVRQTNLDRRGLRPIPIICHLLDPPPLSRYRLPLTSESNAKQISFRFEAKIICETGGPYSCIA
jgi:hypothetical protein